MFTCLSCFVLDLKPWQILQVLLRWFRGCTGKWVSHVLVLGNAITSLTDSSFSNTATSLSSPMAMPPWGDAPYSRASSRKPYLSTIFSLLSPIMASILSWSPLSWILIEPPATSYPFGTRLYACAFTESRFSSSLGMSSVFGEVNGGVPGRQAISPRQARRA